MVIDFECLKFCCPWNYDRGLTEILTIGLVKFIVSEEKLLGLNPLISNIKILIFLDTETIRLRKYLELLFVRFCCISFMSDGSFYIVRKIPQNYFDTTITSIDENYSNMAFSYMDLSYCISSQFNSLYIYSRILIIGNMR
jgi:hypothetical protein